MLEPAIPVNEATRIAALRSLNILDTPREERFDRLTRLAQQLIGVPIAVVSLVDTNRQWFKSCQGLDASETPRSISFCGHAIHSDQLFVIPDAQLDPRFADNPLVTGAPYIRFYAGQPLHARDGSRIGTLCVIDCKPHQLTESHRNSMRDLALLVEHELDNLETEETVAATQESAERLRLALAASNSCMWDADLVTGRLTLDEHWSELLGEKPHEAVVSFEELIQLVPPEEAPQVKRQLTAALKGEITDYLMEHRIRHRLGHYFWIESRGRVITRDTNGKALRMIGTNTDITERKNTEDSLARSVNLHRAIVDGADHLMITTDTEGVIQAFNPAAENSLGYLAEELIGKSTPAMFHVPVEVKRRAQELTSAGIPVEPGFEVFVAVSRTQQKGDSHEWTYVRKDGSHFPVSLTVSALRDATGGIYAFLGIATDISEQKKVERIQAQFSAIIESSSDAIMSKTLDGIITSWNPAAERMFGYSAHEIIGQPMARLIPPDRSEEEPQILAKIRRGEHIEHFETMRKRKNGEIFPISVTISPIRGQSGDIIGASKITRDITERNRAIEEQRENEARLAGILDNVLDGIITISERGIVESFNKSAEHIFDYAASEVIGNNVKMLMPEPYHSEHDGYLDNFTSTGRKKIIGIGRQVVGRRKDGTTFPMDLAVSEMWLGEIRMFTGIVRDITDRVRIERMKSEFISTVSHELRTPLTSIRGSLGLIAGGVAGELPAQAKVLVDIAHKNSERLILLVNDILDMEKIEAGKMDFHIAPVKLQPLLEQSIEANRGYAEQYKVSFQLDNNLPEALINVDANRLLQVLANLLSNAAKYSPPGDQVTIITKAAGDRARIEVQDHGSGIPDEFRSHIFQKFAQADSSDTRKKGGTGLGLSITKAIVEQMDGSIGFTSKPDVLTTFFIEFPLVKQANFSATKSSEAVGRRVLICEDDPDIAVLLRLMLEQAGLDSDIAYDANQAKQLLALNSYAAMTLDLALPGQDGISLIRELRKSPSTSSLPIMVVSAKAIEGRKELGGDAFCVVDWISKPINQKQLMGALKEAVGRICSDRPKVLHVEDDLDIFRVVHTIVSQFAEVENAQTISDARKILAEDHYDLVILDLSLPDGIGMELLPYLNSFSPPVPVLVFSAQELGHDDAIKVQSALVKSRTDNNQLLDTIKKLIKV